MNAQPKLKPVPDVAEIGSVTPDGYLIGNDTLALLGNGDVKEGRAFVRSMIADEREHTPKPAPLAKPESVRIAGPEDEAQVCALLFEDLSRTAGTYAPIAPDKVLHNIQIGTRQQGGIVGVIEQDGRIVACTVLVPSQPAHSNVWYLHELWNVVHHDYRRSRHAVDLVNFCKWSADEMTRSFGFPVYVLMIVNTGDNPRYVMRFFRRHMRQIGGTFIYPER